MIVVSLIVTVTMVDIGVMRMAVNYWVMLVNMSMLLLGSDLFTCVVLVVLVVNVGMTVRYRRMFMFVFMVLREVKPDPRRHQHTCNGSQRALELIEEQER